MFLGYKVFIYNLLNIFYNLILHILCVFFLICFRATIQSILYIVKVPILWKQVGSNYLSLGLAVFQLILK